MKEDWLKSIHDRMVDYEAAEPHNLWEDICRTKKKEDEKKKLDFTKYVATLWTKRSIAAAAIIAIVSTMGYRIIFENQTTTTIKLSDVSNAQTTLTSESSLTQSIQTKEIVSTSIKRHSHRQSAKLLTESIPSVETKASSLADDAATDSSDEKTLRENNEKQKAIKGIRQATSEKPQSPNTKNGFSPANLAKSNGQGNNVSNFSLGVFTTGGTGSSFRQKSMGEIFASDTEPDDSELEDSPMLAIRLSNQGKEVETNIKHRLPIKAGILFTYKLNDNISIESGITYTNLTSDIKEGSKNHYFTGEQTLHYVGIPLNLKSKIYAWKGIELYASSGILAEKCVSGYMKKEYVLDNTLIKTETTDIDINPLQWSANAALGVQYNITNLTSLYAEPGLSYYFKDGSSIKTIYKEKPLNFNLNLGLRFTFGNT